MTRQRLAVLDVVRSDRCHHTAAEIFELAKRRLPNISRATVYNNLKELERQGEIRKISGDGLADRFDGERMPHAHAVCTECGRMWDIDIPGILEDIKNALGREISSFEMKVRTFCTSCVK